MLLGHQIVLFGVTSSNSRGFVNSLSSHGSTHEAMCSDFCMQLTEAELSHHMLVTSGLPDSQCGSQSHMSDYMTKVTPSRRFSWCLFAYLVVKACISLCLTTSATRSSALSSTACGLLECFEVTETMAGAGGWNCVWHKRGQAAYSTS